MAIQEEIMINSSNRKFGLNLQKYNNGYFISISEDELRIGSISVSLSTVNRINTAKVIQDKYDQMFIDTLSKRIAGTINGICIISLFTKNKLQLEEMKMINDKILSLIEVKVDKENEYRNEQRPS